MPLAGLLAGVALAAQAPALRPGQPVPLLPRPIGRDTATLPCWLAEHQGELYYLGTQGSTSSAFYPPQLLHDVLVEATIADGPRICGGGPLTAVEVSVMPELNRACNAVLPADPRFSAPASPAAPIPRFADDTREFVIPFDFDSDYLTLHTTRVIEEAVRIARVTKPARVSVVGRRGRSQLQGGRLMTERVGIDRQRAEKVADILVRLGVSQATVREESEAGRPVAGSDGPRSRQLSIRFQ